MKKLALGISDFKQLIEDDRYFIDKSLFIKEIIDSEENITLIPRPRRFGKTLNLSMLHYFYEREIGEENQEGQVGSNDKKKGNSHLFKGLAILDAGDECLRKMGNHPVIFMTFKDVKSSNWESCYSGIRDVISKEYERHIYLLKSNLNQFNIDYINRIIGKTGDEIDFHNSLKYLSEFLYNFYGTNPVILIDDYDMPIQAGYVSKYYDEVIEFIRNFLSGGLKDNKFLERGVLTGILRVAKESIFSGLNNIEVCSIVSNRYADKFGFSEEEVFELLNYKKVKFDKKKVRKWYDGYRFGENEIYNPWSVLKFASSGGDFDPYWINTSGNELVIRLLSESDKNFKKDLEDLLDGKYIEKTVDDNIVYGDIENSSDTIWNFLFFSGYLKNISCEREIRKTVCKLIIPNEEVLYFYETTIINWFNRNEGVLDIKELKDSLLNGDTNTFKSIFTNFAINSLSYFDVKGKNPEKFYHAFVLGLMYHFNDVYEIRSNRESGYGRYDVMLIPKDKKKHFGIVIEFKSVDLILDETLDSAIAGALLQIKEKKYRAELEACGVENIREIAIAFEGKKVLVDFRV